jgi:hypothetical protein
MKGSCAKEQDKETSHFTPKKPRSKASQKRVISQHQLTCENIIVILTNSLLLASLSVCYGPCLARSWSADLQLSSSTLHNKSCKKKKQNKKYCKDFAFSPRASLVINSFLLKKYWLYKIF